MRAVIDTNILVSALLRAESPPAMVVRGVVTYRLTPVVCDAIMAEYRFVLPRPRLGLNHTKVAELLGLFEQQAEWVEVPPYPGTPDLPDPSDWPFMACALAAACPVVTGNTKHFPVNMGLSIVTAREWLDGTAA